MQKLTIEIDLEGAIQRALSPETLNPVLHKHISEAIAGAIANATNYKSPFRAAVEKQLADVFPHGLSIADVAKFQQVLNTQLTSLAADANNATIATALTAAVSKVIPNLPQSITLSELMAQIKGSNITIGSDHGEFYALVEETDYDGFLFFFCDFGLTQGGRSRTRDDVKYRAKNRLSINKDGHVYAMRMDGDHITPMSMPTVIGPLEATLLALYTGRTRLEIDIDDDEVESLASGNQD